ncbi:MAG TPA: FUSC family protein [Methylophaga aminisulfidivorans]|nr:FUSC family protein [Methylophaga aminisulfidivorans]
MSVNLASIKQALASWAKQEGLTLLFIIQGLIAIFLTLWLAMRLELPQPAVACITVIIVMQPQSGQVLVKGAYRFLGTIIGCVAMLVLVALVAQERVLFLLVVAIWIGLCAAGAMAFRDYRSYAFVLAGYTATLIGIPAVQNPDAAFMMAVWRLLEIGLGIVCASVISACLLPQTSTKAMQQSVKKRFGEFTAFVLENLAEPDNQQQYEHSMLLFATQAVGWENLRNVSSIEDYVSKQRKQRLARLNQEFMQLTSRYAGLHSLLQRVRLHYDNDITTAIDSCLAIVKDTIAPYRGSSLSSQQAKQVADIIATKQENLRLQIRAESARMTVLLSEQQKLDFDTACELIYRLFDEMRSYCDTQASLLTEQHPYEHESTRFQTKLNPVGALITGLRTSFIVLTFGSVWIATAWPSGNNFAMVAIAISAIVTTTPNPARSARQITLGTFIACLLGSLVNLVVLPQIDGFALLCFALAPVYVMGFYLSTQPKFAGYGMGLLIFFTFGAVPLNPAVFDPQLVINNYISLVLAQAMVAVILTVIIPADNGYVWSRLNKEMRLQIPTLFKPKQAQRRQRFESQTRDLLSQCYGFAGDSPEQYKNLIRMSFAVQIIGHAIIEMEETEQQLLSEKSVNHDWLQQKEILKQYVTALFKRPNTIQQGILLEQLATMMDWLRPQISTLSRFESSPPKQLLSHLHIIRNTVLDSHLFNLSSVTSSEGGNYAA